jgi:hypothetical protein
MKLMQSICCLFSRRCASEASEARSAERDASDAVLRDAHTAPQNSPRPPTRETKDSGSGSGSSG